MMVSLNMSYTYRHQLTSQCLICGLRVHWRGNDETV
jgi:hypothetical protein